MAIYQNTKELRTINALEKVTTIVRKWMEVGIMQYIYECDVKPENKQIFNGLEYKKFTMSGLGSVASVSFLMHSKHTPVLLQMMCEDGLIDRRMVSIEYASYPTHQPTRAEYFYVYRVTDKGQDILRKHGLI